MKTKSKPEPKREDFSIFQALLLAQPTPKKLAEMQATLTRVSEVVDKLLAG